MINLIYVPLFGFWACVLLCLIGLLFCASVIGIPVGLTFIALGFKLLTLKRRPKITVNTCP